MEGARFGQVVEDGAGGRMVIRAIAEWTAGAIYEFDLFIHRARRLDPPHFHPNQEERFQGVGGTPHVMINGKPHLHRSGDQLVVPPGADHTVGNSSAKVGRPIASFRPARTLPCQACAAAKPWRTNIVVPAGLSARPAPPPRFRSRGSRIAASALFGAGSSPARTASNLSGDERRWLMHRPA